MKAFVTSGYRDEAGRLRLRNRAAMDGWIERRRKAAEFIVTIEPKHAIRSLASNSFYWAVVIEHLSDYTGFTPLECHEYLKARFLPRRLAVAGKNGQIVDERVVGGTTTSLNNVEFSDYLREIKQWMLDDLGILVPEPTE